MEREANGRFGNGNKSGRGGNRPGAGRKTKEFERAMRLATEIVNKMMEDYLQPVFERYWEAATGQCFPGSKLHKVQFDAATNRHYIERFVAQAKAIHVNKETSIESFFEKVDAEYERAKDSGELEELKKATGR